MVFNIYTFRIIRRLHGGGGSYCGGAVVVAVEVEVVAHDGGDGGPLDLRDSSTLVSVCIEGGGIVRREPDPDPHEIKYIIKL